MGTFSSAEVARFTHREGVLILRRVSNSSHWEGWDIRVWVSRADGEMRPTRKGISLSDEQAAWLIAELGRDRKATLRAIVNEEAEDDRALRLAKPEEA